MDKTWDSSRKRYVYKPDVNEVATVSAVCEVIISNHDHFPPDQFESGLAHSIATLISHNEGWTKDQAVSFDTLLRKFDLGQLTIPLAGKSNYAMLLDLFEGIEPIPSNPPVTTL